MSDIVPNLFTDLFAKKVGKIDAAIEAIGGVYTGHDGADFCLEAEDDLIGGDYLCQALLNTDGKEREWTITISARTVDGWRSILSCHANFVSGVLTSLYWMGNMSPFPVAYEGKEYRTTEALFQCLRVSDEETRELIRAETSPMAAKFKAKALAHMRTVECLSEADLDLMRLCLRLKIERHPQLRRWLAQTADLPIVEDCSRRPHGTGLFWGAAHVRGDEWNGFNMLGVLWSELRTEVLADREA